MPSAARVLRTFASTWSSWAGLPQKLWTDRGKEFMGAFGKHLSDHGVETAAAALESPWQNGRCERHGGIWKDMFMKVCMDSQLTGPDDVMIASTILTQTKNELYRQGGYSPSQNGFGLAWAAHPRLVASARRGATA